MERQKHAQIVADAIYESFIKEDHGDWLGRTGKIIRLPTLRFHQTRKAFQGLRDAVAGAEIVQKRFWTKACMRDAVILMMKQRKLHVPQTAGFNWKDWLKEQVSDLHSLAIKARRNEWRNMADAVETLPYNVEEILGDVW